MNFLINDEAIRISNRNEERDKMLIEHDKNQLIEIDKLKEEL